MNSTQRADRTTVFVLLQLDTALFGDGKSQQQVLIDALEMGIVVNQDDEVPGHNELLRYFDRFEDAIADRQNYLNKVRFASELECFGIIYQVSISPKLLDKEHHGIMLDKTSSMEYSELHHHYSIVAQFDPKSSLSDSDKATFASITRQHVDSVNHLDSSQSKPFFRGQTAAQTTTEKSDNDDPTTVLLFDKFKSLYQQQDNCIEAFLDLSEHIHDFINGDIIPSRLRTMEKRDPNAKALIEFVDGVIAKYVNFVEHLEQHANLLERATMTPDSQHHSQTRLASAYQEMMDCLDKPQAYTLIMHIDAGAEEKSQLAKLLLANDLSTSKASEIAKRVLALFDETDITSITT